MIAVEARGDENEVGCELPADRHHDLVEGVRVFGVAEARGKRQVHGASRRRTLPHLLGRARARVVRVLVRGDVQHVGVRLEDVLRAVAVVQVPVDDGDPANTAGPQECGRHRHVVEEAEAHRAVALGVMAGRPDEREAALHLAAEDRLAAREEAPGGEPRRSGGGGRRDRVRVEDDARLARRARHALDVSARVDLRELVVGRGARLEANEVTRAGEVIEENLQSLGALGMAASRIVRQHAGVGDHRRAAGHRGER